MSTKMPKRDITGECEGECRDRVNEGTKDRQDALEKEGVKAPESYPDVPGAEKHINPDNPPAGIAGRGKPQSLEGQDATAKTLTERGSEVYGQAEQAASDAYDKTAQAVSETYDQAKNFSSENPGKTILFALGIGVGLGFLLGASCRR